MILDFLINIRALSAYNIAFFTASACVLTALGAYLIGNINPAILIGKLHGIDIRKKGSGNAGMTNTIRVIGLRAGIAVFVIDVLKAYAAVFIGSQLLSESGAMIAFASVVLGHCYPVFYGFKGGKGVAASFGAALALDWHSALLALAVAGVVFLISGKRMSIASIAAIISYPVFVKLLLGKNSFFIFSIAAVLFLVVQHAANIKRIVHGEENSLTIGHAGQESSEHKKDKEGTKE